MHREGTTDKIFRKCDGDMTRPGGRVHPSGVPYYVMMNLFRNHCGNIFDCYRFLRVQGASRWLRITGATTNHRRKNGGRWRDGSARRNTCVLTEAGMVDVE